MKERIIGAVVLVLVVVLVVPVFLDGPPGADEIVTQAVPLPGQEDQKTQTVVLERDRTDPVPVAANNAAEQAAPAETASRREPEPMPVVKSPPEPVVEESPAPAAATTSSSTGMWAVQLGSFGNQENAERLAAELRQQGFAAFLSKLDTPTGELHRVRIGPQKDRESAEAMAARLKKAGHEGKVLPHP